MCECKSSDNAQPRRRVKQLAEAQSESGEIAQLLCGGNNPGEAESDKDRREKKIADKWKVSYTRYFKERQKKVETKKEHVQFLENSYYVAVSTIEIAFQYHTYTRDSNKWHPILEFRDAVMKTLDALVLIRPNLQSELVTAKAAIEKIEGGCDMGGCPFVSLKYVEPESEKLQILLTSRDKMLARVKVQHESVYNIGKRASEIAKQAIQEFKEKTNNFDVTRMESERQKLFCEFVQSTALFTIALKELYEDSLASATAR